MKLIGKERLSSLQGVSTEVDVWISAWVSELSNAVWGRPLDLQESFPKVVKINEFIFVFPVISSRYKIKVVLSFTKNIVLISEVTANEK